jgi:hypothetical protein
MTEETLTENQMSYLATMASCHEANVGKLPKTIKELADHWYDCAERMLAGPDEMFDDDRIGECIWLRQLEKRPDADALLADAIKIRAAMNRAEEISREQARADDDEDIPF